MKESEISKNCSYVKCTVWDRDPVMTQMCMIGTVIFLKTMKKSEAHIQPTAACGVNIRCVEKLILGSRLKCVVLHPALA
jgi:hypothetical protein